MSARLKQIGTTSALAGILAASALPGRAQVQIDAAQLARLDDIKGRIAQLKQTAEDAPRPAAAAAEIKRVQLIDVADASVIMIPGGCTKTQEHWYGNSEETVDCYGILLKGARGSDAFQKDRELSDILIFPAPTIEYATDSLRRIAVSLGKKEAADGETVRISELTFLGADVKLSVLTKQANDTGSVKLGGLTIYTEVVEGDWTVKKARRIGLGQ